MIEHPQQEQIDELVSGFRALLESNRPADPDDAVNPADAFFMYRLLLGRNPNTTVELPALLRDRRTFRELRQGVLDSDEFASGGTFTPPDRLWMTELGEFRFWFNTSDREMGELRAVAEEHPGERIRPTRARLSTGVLERGDRDRGLSSREDVRRGNGPGRPAGVDDGRAIGRGRRRTRRPDQARCRGA